MNNRLKDLSASFPLLPADLEAKISLVIPVYNEAAYLAELFAHFDRFPIFEAIFIDGGSSDQTAQLLQKWAKYQTGQFRRIVSSAVRGRGNQMNEGAKMATGDILLFLHADSKLPSGAINNVREVLKRAEFVGGAFRLKIDSSHFFLGFISWMANLRSTYLGLPYGDQGYFVRREVFERLKGYKAIALMEDVDFFRRLKKMGRVALLKKVVHTSARRWDQGGYYFTSFRNLLILFSYFFGISPNRLASWYRS
ncbi:MAG: TIGR04283 family arsenosugar biosynthesis glycosyltransferase [Nitrospiria bacterium]